MRSFLGSMGRQRVKCCSFGRGVNIFLEKKEEI